MRQAGRSRLSRRALSGAGILKNINFKFTCRCFLYGNSGIFVQAIRAGRLFSDPALYNLKCYYDVEVRCSGLVKKTTDVVIRKKITAAAAVIIRP